MPLDPNIILQAQAPKQIDPISSIGALMQVRGQMADIALRQQQTAQAAQTTEENRAKQVQANRDLADQNTLQALEKDHEAYADIHSGDPVKIGKRLGGIVQPKTLSAVQDYTNKQIEQQATLHTTELNQRKEASEQVGQTIDGLIRMVEEDGGKVDRANQNFISAKAALGPELAALKVDPSQLPNSVNSVDDLYRFLAQTKALGSQATAALARKGEQAKAQQAQAAAASSQATADRTNALTPLETTAKQTENETKAKELAGMSNTGLTAAEQATEAETQRHNAQTEAVSRSEVALKQKQFDATFGAGLDANGQPLSPEAMKAAALQDPTAQAIAHYQLAPPPAQTRGGIPSPILRKVLAINPQYDATTYPARAETAKGFSPSGTQGQAITAADTALSHLNTLSQAGDALKNGNVQILNRIANTLGAQAGSTPKATYDTILNMVGPEISKSVIGAVGGEGERAATSKNFTSDLSPQQRESNIAAAVGLLGARYDKSAHAYEQQMGVPLPRALSPESQAIRQKYTGPSQSAQHAVGDTVMYQGKPHKITAIKPDGKLVLEQ